MSIAAASAVGSAWDGHERRRINDPDYTGPEHRVEPRLRALERGHRAISDQQAEIIVTMREALERQPEAIAKAMAAVLRDREVLAAVGRAGAEMIQQAAKEHTGGWLLGGIRSMLGGWVVRAALVLLALKFSGVNAAAMVLDWLKR